MVEDSLTEKAPSPLGFHESGPGSAREWMQSLQVLQEKFAAQTVELQKQTLLFQYMCGQNLDQLSPADLYTLKAQLEHTYGIAKQEYSRRSLCLQCQKQRAVVLLRPCRHIYLCETCAAAQPNKIVNCAICHHSVDDTVIENAASASAVAPATK